MVLRDPKDPLNQSRGIMGPIEGSTVQNNRGRLRQRFDLIRKLGQGTYGKVQLGIDKETGQEVAIKTIKKSKIETEADLIRIRREIQIMSSVRHPNIIHIYEVFENREKMVLVMEYASGGELYDYLSERKVLQEDEARRIFRQIASAVYYCHKHKICHRDLKLENILLDEKANAKIADFGLSNVFDDVNLLKTFCGSPLYASPEIVRGTPYYGPEVDCWSLGVLLYTLVYGAMPFDGSNFKRLVKQISNGEYYEPKKPAEASLLIRRMLTVDPLKRTSIKDVCSHQWINKGFTTSCLETAEQLANQTPVRLDLLLSVAPGHNINHTQVVIACNQDELHSLPSEPPGTKSIAEKTAEAAQSKPDVHVGRAQNPAPTAKVHQTNKTATCKGQDNKLKAAVKKKSKSSPILELIADEDEDIEKQVLGVEQYEDLNQAGDEAGDDTLSEISEIQTLAEDGNGTSKSKSKFLHNNSAQSAENESKKPQSSNLVEKQSLNTEPVPVTTTTVTEAITPIHSEEGACVAEVEEAQAVAPVASATHADPENMADKLDVANNAAKSTSEVVENKVEKLTEGGKSASKPPTVKKKIVKKVTKDQSGKDSASKVEGDKKKLPIKSNATAGTGSSSSVASSVDKAERDSTPSQRSKPRGNSDSNASDVSPTRIERRNSKIISQKTAELIQNLETRASNSPPETGKSKKLVFPSVKVADAKRAFEKSKVVKESSISPAQSNLTEKTKPQRPVEPQESEKATAANSCEEGINVESKSGGERATKLPQAEFKAMESTLPKFNAPSEVPPEAKVSVQAVQSPNGLESDAKVVTRAATSKPSKDSAIAPEPSRDFHEHSSSDQHQGIVKKGVAAGLSKLKMPSGGEVDSPATNQQVKPVYVDNGTGTPKQVVMLVAGRTTPPVKSGSDMESTTDPFVSIDTSIHVATEDNVKPPMKRAKEQAAQKISSVISKIASSENADRGLKKKEKPAKMVKTEVSFPVAAAPSRERVIPIKFDDDVVPSTPPAQVQTDNHASSKTQSAPNIVGGPLKYDRSTSAVSTISRQNSSDTESSIAPPRKPEPIRKSPREFIIPIKLEASGQTLTPKDEPMDAPQAEDPFRGDSRLRSGRFGRQRKYSSLLSDSSYEDEPKGVQSAGTSRRSSATTVTPCHTRSHSQGDEPETSHTPLTASRRFRIKRGSGVPLDRSDSFSSAEEDEEDAFEVLTAESLFSSLLDRVRNLTKRLNRDEEATTSWSTGPESPTIGGWAMSGPFREFVNRASSETRPTGSAASGEFRIRRSFSREPSVTVTISTGPTWRSSLSRQTSRESDNGSVASEIQSSVSSPMYTAGCRSGFYPYRRTTSNGTDDGSMSKSNFSSTDQTRKSSISDFQPRHFDMSSLPVSVAYQSESGNSVRPYERSLSNTDYNLRSSALRHSLHSHDRLRGSQRESIKSSALDAAASMRDGNLSNYCTPNKPYTTPSLNGNNANTSAYATSRNTLPRLGRSVSAAPSEPRQGVSCSQDGSRRGEYCSPQFSMSKFEVSDGTNSASIPGTSRKDGLPDRKIIAKDWTDEGTCGLVLSRDAAKKTIGGTSQPIFPHIPHYCAVGDRTSGSGHDDMKQSQTSPSKNYSVGTSKNSEGFIQDNNYCPDGSKGVANRLPNPVKTVSATSLPTGTTSALKKPVVSDPPDKLPSAAAYSTSKFNTPCSAENNVHNAIAAGALPKRDFRAASVDKITRILQQKSMSKDGLAPSKPAQNSFDMKSAVNATKVYAKGEDNNVKVAKSCMSPKDEKQSVCEATTMEPDSHNQSTKGNKPKFIQSLEKRWEKVTAPLTGAAIDRTESRSRMLTQSKDSSEDLSNLDSESVLLQRAVSPEKKGKTRFGGSTVGFMLGKFRKIEESTTKTSVGGAKIAPNVSSRRALSSYAGASSDSVLTLPKTFQPLAESRSNFAVTAQPQICSTSLKSPSVSKELSLEKTEGNYEEASSQNQTHSSSNFRCTQKNSLIPRRNVQGVCNTVDANIWDTDCEQRLPIDVLPVGSRDTTPTNVYAPQTVIDEKEYDESITTPTSDSLESSSICSEKNEIWGRSVLDEEESVSDRIFRKSFYPRFNSLERKKPATRYLSNSASKANKPQSRSARSLAGANQLSNDLGASESCTVTPAAATTAPTSRISEPQSAPIDSINKYNPNPLFKELITEDLLVPQSSRKAAHSERVTSKLSKLLLEIDSDNADTKAASRQAADRRSLDLGGREKT